MPAPSNPYRTGMTNAGSKFDAFNVPERLPRDATTPEGPGLTAGDLDSIARQHYRDGYAAGERRIAELVERHGDELAHAYDQGWDARGENTVAKANAALASDLRRRLVADLYMPLLDATESSSRTKAELREAIVQARAVLDEMAQRCTVIVHGEAPPEDDAPAGS